MICKPGGMMRRAAHMSRIKDLLNEDFLAAAGAPVGSPRACEPGPGTLLVIDTENKLSISGGTAVIAGGRSQAVTGDPGIYGQVPLAKAAGRALFLKFTAPAASTAVYAGWGGSPSGQPAEAYVYLYGTSVNFPLTKVLQLTSGQPYEWAIVSRGEFGFFYSIRGGIYTDWTLLYATAPIAANGGGLAAKGTLYAGVANNNAAFNVDSIRIADLGGDWETAGMYYQCLARKAASVDGDTLAGATADGLVEHTITAQAGVTQELKVRWSDDDNCWIVRMIQSTGRVQVIERNGGVETTRADIAKNWTVGTQYHIAVSMRGSRISVVNYTNVHYNSASFNSTATGVKVSHAGQDLVAWPITLDLSQKRSLYGPQRSFFAYGDSKVYGTGDTTPPGIGSNGWCYRLALLARAVEYPARIGIGGRTTALARTTIDGELAAAVGTPDAVLYNLGVNDPAINQAWTDDTAYVLDAMHARWPDARIFVNRVWSRADGMAFSAAVEAAQNGLMVSRPWLLPGLDERTALEAGDDGTTYTTDGTHPNHAGHIRCAEQWKTFLGW